MMEGSPFRPLFSKQFSVSPLIFSKWFQNSSDEKLRRNGGGRVRVWKRETEKKNRKLRPPSAPRSSLLRLINFTSEHFVSYEYSSDHADERNTC
jgi:hypothetical protein